MVSFQLLSHGSSWRKNKARSFPGLGVPGNTPVKKEEKKWTGNQWRRGENKVVTFEGLR